MPACLITFAPGLRLLVDECGRLFGRRMRGGKVELRKMLLRLRSRRHVLEPSLRGAKRRSNPDFAFVSWIASLALAMTLIRRSMRLNARLFDHVAPGLRLLV